MEIKVKKLTPTAKMPFRAHPTDAGWDLYVDSKEHDFDGNIVYHSGLAFEIPEGFVGLVFPRSSIAKMQLQLTNCVGVIDSHYRGDVMGKFKEIHYDFTCNKHHHYHDENKEYSVGDRFAQLIIMPFPSVTYVEADELSSSDRGTSGYGGSGIR